MATTRPMRQLARKRLDERLVALKSLPPSSLVAPRGGWIRSIRDAKFLKGSHHQLKRRIARSAGDLAWIGSESELHASKDSKPVTLLSTETMVLRKTGADWRIVHIHWSSRPKKAK